MSTKSPTHNAQFNLKGKLEHRLGCGCCVLFNRKYWQAEKLAKAEMKEADNERA